jgi:hypothetical protein
VVLPPAGFSFAAKELSQRFSDGKQLLIRIFSAVIMRWWWIEAAAHQVSMQSGRA